MHLFEREIAVRNWLLSVGAMILLTAVITLIIPHGRLGKLIKSVFALLSILVIIQPLVNLKNGNADFTVPSITEGNEIVLQQDYLQYIVEKRNQAKEETCEDILNKNGIEGAVVDIEFITDNKASYEIKKVTVNLENSVIISDKEHIDIIEIALAEIADYLDTEREVIELYGQ